MAALLLAAVALTVGRRVVLGVLLTAAVLVASVEHLGGLARTHARHPAAAPSWSATHGHAPRPNLIGLDTPARTAEGAALSVVLH
jgi:hypothetical protein